MLQIVYDGNESITLTTLWGYHKVIGISFWDRTVIIQTPNLDYLKDISRVLEKYRLTFNERNFGGKESQKHSTLKDEIKYSVVRGHLFMYTKRDRKKLQKVLKKITRMGYKISFSYGNWKFELR